MCFDWKEKGVERADPFRCRGLVDGRRLSSGPAWPCHVSPVASGARDEEEKERLEAVGSYWGLGSGAYGLHIFFIVVGRHEQTDFFCGKEFGPNDPSPLVWGIID